jgi:leader peptidase (prepilin peptidase)/N-methyltransferase
MQYPLVEFTTGLVFALLFLKFQDIFLADIQSFGIIYVYYATAFSLLVVIATYDLKHKIIPDMLSLIFGVLAFLGLFFFHNNFLDSSNPIVLYFQIPTVWEFLSGVFIAFPFAFFWFISRGRWMGLGDAKLSLGIGWLLGISVALSGLVMAFWSGAVVGVTLVVLSRLDSARLARLDSARLAKNGRINSMGMKSEIPFAPFLVLGTFLAFIFELNLFNF